MNELVDTYAARGGKGFNFFIEAGLQEELQAAAFGLDIKRVYFEAVGDRLLFFVGWGFLDGRRRRDSRRRADKPHGGVFRIDACFEAFAFARHMFNPPLAFRPPVCYNRGKRCFWARRPVCFAGRPDSP